MKQAANGDIEQQTAFPKAVADMSNEEIGQWLEEILPILSLQNDRVNAYKYTSRLEYRGPSNKELKKDSDICSRQIRLASIQLQFRLEAEIKTKRNTDAIKALKDMCDGRLKLSDELGGVLTKFNDEKYRRFDRVTRFFGLLAGIPAAVAALADKLYPGNIVIVSGAALTTLAACLVGVFPDETATCAQLSGKWALAKAQVALRKSHKFEQQTAHNIRYSAITASLAVGISEMSRDIPAASIKQRIPTRQEQRLELGALPSMKLITASGRYCCG